MAEEVRFDWARGDRTGVPEAVLAEGKSEAQLSQIAEEAAARGQPVFLTRMTITQAEFLAGEGVVDYDPISRTGVLGAAPEMHRAEEVAIVAAGSSDMPTAREALRALAFFGVDAPLYADIGVAGLWRLQEIAPKLRPARVIIAVAGMEGALFSVLAGLTPALVIAVPSPVGYGVSAGGQAALTAALASCAPGVLAVNIGNGFGAAAAAWKVIAPREPSEA